MADSTVWIDFFNHKTINHQKTRLELWLKKKAHVFICPVIYQEVLQGVRDENVFSKMKIYLHKFPVDSVDIMQVTEYAIDIYRNLQKRGITIRKAADCLIAAYALIGNMYLLHNDKDFTAIASYYPLKIVSILPTKNQI